MPALILVFTVSQFVPVENAGFTVLRLAIHAMALTGASVRANELAHERHKLDEHLPLANRR